MSDYTKGPWSQGHDGGYNPNTLFGANGEAVAQCYGIPLHTRLGDLNDEARWKEGLANARLIASAPELDKALRGLLNLVAKYMSHDDWHEIQYAKQVLTKLEGK